MKKSITWILLFPALLTIGLKSASAQITDDSPVKIETVLRNVPVIVSDKSGRFVGGLTKEDFAVFQDGRKQTIEFFANTEEPMNVAILIDTSMSTMGVLDAIKKSAKDFLTTFGANDRGMIVGFDDSVKTYSNLSSDQRQLEKALDSISVADRFGSGMNDAVYRVIAKDFAAVKGRKAIVVLTDGFVDGKISKRMFANTLSNSDVVIYPIVFMTPVIATYFPPNTKTISVQQLLNLPLINALNETTVSTGGRVYLAGVSEFKRAFQNITDELKKQYVIGYYPVDADAQNNEKIVVEVAGRDFTVRTKKNKQSETAPVSSVFKN